MVSMFTQNSENSMSPFIRVTTPKCTTLTLLVLHVVFYTVLQMEGEMHSRPAKCNTVYCEIEEKKCERIESMCFCFLCGHSRIIFIFRVGKCTVLEFGAKKSTHHNTNISKLPTYTKLTVADIPT